MKVIGTVAQLLDRPELALGGLTCRDTPNRWSDYKDMPQVELFVGDLGECIVTSCFMPIKLSSTELFFDQTYPNVRQFHSIHPIVDDADAKFSVELAEPRRHNGITVLIGGSPENNWYHWVLNWFPRLALTAALHPSLIEDQSVKFAFHSNVEFEPYRSFIDLFNISTERLIFFEPDDARSFERLLVPTFGNPNLYYPALYRMTRRVLFDIIGGKPRDLLPFGRIFVSRETIAQPKRRVVNLEEIYTALESNKIIPVVLDGRSGVEQIAMFSSCELVVGVHGAGLANLIFCKPDTRVIILDNRRNIHAGMTGMFSGLCRVIGLRHMILPVEELEIEGVDYANFYNIHNRDVIVSVTGLTDMISHFEKDDQPTYLSSAVTHRQLDEYIAKTDDLLRDIEPFVGIAPIGYEVDYLGIETGLHLIAHWYPPSMAEEARSHPRHRTTLRPTPLAGEPYFESGSVLRAILEGGDVVRIIELGGGYGARSCELAFHCGRLGKTARSIIVEPVEQYILWGREHFAHNKLDPTDHVFVQSAAGAGSKPVPMRTAYQGFGNEVVRNETANADETVSVLALLSGEALILRDGSTVEMVNSLPLSAILAPFDVVDLVDIDVQHLEYAILHPAWEILNRKVRRLHIGTHALPLQASVRSDLIEHGWTIEVDLSPYSETACLHGPTKINDGILAAFNPRLQS